jgi:hypothetical protein
MVGIGTHGGAYSARRLLEVRMEVTCTRIATGSPFKVFWAA